MKRKISLLLAALMTISALAGCAQNEPEPAPAPDPTPEVSTGDETKEPEAEAWVPGTTMSWLCASKAGSAADNFTRKAQGVIDSLGLIDQTFIVENITDGSGAVAWRQLIDTTGDEADITICTYNLGDVVTMLQNTDMTPASFRVIATVAQDKKFLYVSSSAPFDDFEGLVTYLKDNDVILGGGKADDNVMYALLKNTIDANDHLSYLQTGDTAGTLTAVLGDQVYLGIGKLSTLKDYIESGELKAIAIEGSERAEGILSNVPTFSEMGYDGIDFIQTRCVVASPNMSDEAYDFWCDIFATVSESAEFAAEYSDVYNTAVLGLVGADAQTYLEGAEASVIAAGLAG